MNSLLKKSMELQISLSGVNFRKSDEIASHSQFFRIKILKTKQ